MAEIRAFDDSDGGGDFVQILVRHGDLAAFDQFGNGAGDVFGADFDDAVRRVENGGLLHLARQLFPFRLVHAEAGAEGTEAEKEQINDNKGKVNIKPKRGKALVVEYNVIKHFQ